MFGIGKRVITVFAEIHVKCKTGSCTCRWLLIYPYFFLLAQGYKIFFEGFQCKHTAVAELSCKNRHTLCTLTHRRVETTLPQTFFSRKYIFSNSKQYIKGPQANLAENNKNIDIKGP